MNVVALYVRVHKPEARCRHRFRSCGWAESCQIRTFGAGGQAAHLQGSSSADIEAAQRPRVIAAIDACYPKNVPLECTTKAQGPKSRGVETGSSRNANDCGVSQFARLLRLCRLLCHALCKPDWRSSKRFTGSAVPARPSRVGVYFPLFNRRRWSVSETGCNQRKLNAQSLCQEAYHG